MKFMRSMSTAALMALLSIPAAAQNSADTTATADAPKYAAIPRSQRPVLVVMPFEFQAQLSDADKAELNTLTAALMAYKGQDPTKQLQQNLDNLGKSTATLLTEALLATSQFRVLERQAIETVLQEQNLTASDRAASNQTVAEKAKVLGAKYIVTGAITKFGKEKKEKGGALGMLAKQAAGLGGIGIAQTTYTVAITARVVDAATGEVLTSITSDGEVKGGRRLALGGGGGGGGGGGALGGVFGSNSSGDKEKKVAESIAMAVEKMVDNFVKARERGDIEP